MLNRKSKKNGPSRPCPYCGVFQTRLTRHLRLRHKNEKDVLHALSLPKCKRNDAFAALKKDGIYHHNVDLIQTNPKAKLVRERKQGTPKDLVLCGTCHGCYNRAYLWKHKQNCQSSLPAAESIPVSLLHITSASDSFKANILSSFVSDDVGKICQSDPTILLLGLFTKIAQKPDKKSGVKHSVMANMRMLANLYKEFKDQNPPSPSNPATSIDMLERRNFPALEQAIQQYTSSGNQLKAGLKSSVYYLLKKTASAVKANFIINHEDEKASEIDKFVVVLEMHHTSLFGDATYKINVNRQTNLRRPKNLPSEEAIAKVRSYTVTTMKAITRQTITPKKFTLLRDLAVCRLTLFNFRRGGEPARLKMSDWFDARNELWIDQSRIVKMKPVEQEMFSDLKIMYQTGKGNDHLVPVLVPTDVTPALSILTTPETRKLVGVPEQNKYLFPVVRAEGHCSGYHSMRKIVSLSGVDDCSSITATKMRHYSSTQYAALDVPADQRKYFYLHMGHSRHINESIYQTPLAEAEVTVVGKFLQQIDEGTLMLVYAFCYVFVLLVWGQINGLYT